MEQRQRMRESHDTETLQEGRALNVEAEEDEQQSSFPMNEDHGDWVASVSAASSTLQRSPSTEGNDQDPHVSKSSFKQFPDIYSKSYTAVSNECRKTSAKYDLRKTKHLCSFFHFLDVPCSDQVYKKTCDNNPNCLHGLGYCGFIKGGKHENDVLFIPKSSTFYQHLAISKVSIRQNARKPGCFCWFAKSGSNLLLEYLVSNVVSPFSIPTTVI
jgi:hypothetical protein